MDFQVSSPLLFSSLITLLATFFIALRSLSFRVNIFASVTGILFSSWLFLLSQFSETENHFVFILFFLLPTIIISSVFLTLRHLHGKSSEKTIFPISSWTNLYMSSKIILVCFSLIFLIFIPFAVFDIEKNLLLQMVNVSLLFGFIFTFFDSFLIAFLAFDFLKKIIHEEKWGVPEIFATVFYCFLSLFSFFSLSLISETFFLSFEFSLTNFFFQSENLPLLLPAVSLGLVLLLTTLVHNKNFLSFKISLTQFLGSFIVLLSLMSVVNSSSVENLILRLILLFILSFLSYFLVKSVLSEIKNKKALQETGKQIFEANKALKSLDKAKSTFISSASHQLRSPLSVIKGISSMLIDGSYGNLKPSHKDALTKIFISNERLISLIEDLLDISHLEEGKVEFTFEKKDLNSVAEKAVMGLSLQSKSKKLYLRFTPFRKSPVLAWVDEQKITEVVSNLIDNAIKYTRRGGITVEVKKFKTYAQIRVRDTGIGLKKQEINHLFEKFVRAGRGNKMSTVGTGLGLYVVKKMTLAHKAKVWVESAGEGKGSTFILQMPLNLNAPPDGRYIKSVLVSKK